MCGFFRPSKRIEHFAYIPAAIEGFKHGACRTVVSCPVSQLRISTFILPRSFRVYSFEPHGGFALLFGGNRALRVSATAHSLSAAHGIMLSRYFGTDLLSRNICERIMFLSILFRRKSRGAFSSARPAWEKA